MNDSSASIEAVIRRHYESYRQSRRLRGDVQRAARRIRDCRTAALGGHVERCECGEVSRICYNSCRHRSCPQCQGGRRARWLQDLTRQLLPCDHVHVIFTVPETLNSLWQFNRARFADLLLRAARESLDELLRDPQYLGARPGIITALHTWGRNLSVHPHAHCLVSAGGLDDNGRFVALQGATLLPARVLMAVFRGKLRFLLKSAVDDGELVVPSSTTAARLQSLLNWLGRVPWNVRIQERYTHGVSVAGYLARYITGGPVSNQRIHSVTATEVAFWYRDHRDGAKKLMRLHPHEFLSRWFEHVPPHGLRTIRRSGLYANSCVQQREAIRAELAAVNPGLATAASAVTDLEVPRCPVCNTEVRRRDLIQILFSANDSREFIVALGQPP